MGGSFILGSGGPCSLKNTNYWDIPRTSRDLPTILLGHFAGKVLRTPARSGKIMSQNGRFFAMTHLSYKVKEVRNYVFRGHPRGHPSRTDRP